MEELALLAAAELKAISRFLPLALLAKQVFLTHTTLRPSDTNSRVGRAQAPSSSSLTGAREPSRLSPLGSTLPREPTGPNLPFSAAGSLPPGQ